MEKVDLAPTTVIGKTGYMEVHVETVTAIQEYAGPAAYVFFTNH